MTGEPNEVRRSGPATVDERERVLVRDPRTAERFTFFASGPFDEPTADEA